MIIESPHECTIVGSDGRPFTARCQWIYHDDAPFVLLLHIPVGGGVVREWSFSHELLEEGLGTVAGRGDVRIWPDGELLCVDLSSPSGACRLTTSWRIACEFIGRIHDHAPVLYELQVLESQIDQGLQELRGITP